MTLLGQFYTAFHADFQGCSYHPHLLLLLDLTHPDTGLMAMPISSLELHA
jgi:hypothetical protein